jgi:photosystem II stability/assembly factor-like uncharacterized protein
VPVSARAETLALTSLASGTSVRLQAVSVVSADVAWVSGLEGTFLRTLDGGSTWERGTVEGAETLQFRDVHAVSADTAYLLSAGPGEQSRIYKTRDGGGSWELQYRNDEPEGFLDCFDFWDEAHGLVYGDSVGGELRVLETSNGEQWTKIPADRLPAAHAGEGGFAASGTCAVALSGATAFVGTGAGSARILKTRDRGLTWEAIEIPIASSTPTSGILSLAFRSEEEGVAAGGDISSEDLRSDVLALTSDGGRSFRLATPPTFAGAVYAVAFVPRASPPILVAVGPRGASYSIDLARSWLPLSDESYWSLAFSADGHGLLVGPDGRIARIESERAGAPRIR